MGKRRYGKWRSAVDTAFSKPRLHIPIPRGGIKVIVYTCGHIYVLRWLDPVAAMCPECGHGTVRQIE